MHSPNNDKTACAMSHFDEKVFLKKMIGHGSAGIVFEAYNKELSNHCAFKIVIVA